MNRRILARCVNSAAAGRFLGLLERAESRRGNLLRVLTYHRVQDASLFGEQMSYLKARHRVVSVQDLLAAYTQGKELPPRSVMITFDDAYRDFAERAWPVLRELSLPVAVFVPTAFPDNPGAVFWWDRLDWAFERTPRRDEVSTPAGRLRLGTAAERRQGLSLVKRFLKEQPLTELERLVAEVCSPLAAPPAPQEVLGWGELRRLAREGVVLGAHTRTHPFLSRLTPEAARAETLGSLADLRREIGEVLPIFAYPDGRHNQLALEAVRAAGFTLAFTTRRGTNDLRRAEPLALRRINITRAAPLSTLRARLLHSSIYLNPWRRFFDRQPAVHH